MDDKKLKQIGAIIAIIASVVLFFKKQGGVGFFFLLIGLILFIRSKKGENYMSMWIFLVEGIFFIFRLFSYLISFTIQSF